MTMLTIRIAAAAIAMCATTTLAAAQATVPAPAPRQQPAQAAPTAPAQTPTTAGAQRVPQPLQTVGPTASLRTTFGAWQQRCETLPGAPAEQCALVQNVTAADRAYIGVIAIVFRTADRQTTVMRVIVPLGVHLQGGLAVMIDGQSIGGTDFIRCLPNGCIAEARLDDTLQNRMRQGRQLTFVVFDSPEEGIGIPISLEGLAAGLDALSR
jgi:invasion protein IalB